VQLSYQETACSSGTAATTWCWTATRTTTATRSAPQGPGTNADGIGAHISAGHPGNVFRGDRSWWNSDGFDLINAFASVTIEDWWTREAHRRDVRGLR
jgi:hypothetical protein